MARLAPAVFANPEALAGFAFCAVVGVAPCAVVNVEFAAGEALSRDKVVPVVVAAFPEARVGVDKEFVANEAAFV